MDGQLRKLAAGHARSYRNYKAFLRGYGDGYATGAPTGTPAGAPIEGKGEGQKVEEKMEDRAMSQRAKMRADWVAVIEAVREKLEQTDPEKGEVFVRLFDLDGYGKARDNRVIRLAMDLNTSEANIYRWRENILDQMILAATERGLLHPFGEGRKE